MRATRSAIVVTAVIAVLATACGASEPTAGDPPGEEADAGLDGTVDDTDDDQPAEGGDQIEGEVSLDAATEAAVADLAATEGVDVSVIEVVTAEEVTWSDGSLGCPEPDGMYTQALVPGFRIVLAVEGDEIHYHGAAGAEATRCDDPRPPADA